ncbi:hypothetical protein LSAT2_016911 [Lamellibrachia satsuma]|nr:hypothetical protein LSAT2_016911 [Lamellibrachia satsuma]
MTPTESAVSPGLPVTLMTPTESAVSPGLPVTLMTPTESAVSPGLPVTLMTPTESAVSPGLPVTLMTPTESAVSPGLPVTLMTPTESAVSPGLPVTLMTPTESAVSPGLPVTLMTPTESAVSPGLPVTLMTPTESAVSPGLPVTLMTPTESAVSPGLPVTLMTPTEERPRINSQTVDLEGLKSLPDCTFGKVYSNWLQENRCHPDQRLPVHFVDDPDLAYVMTRYREIHDLVHALLGMPTHMLGEVTIKWVEGLQTGLPMCLSGGLFGALRLRPKQRRAYWDSHLAYALRCGLKGKMLMNLYFENNWETPVEELRVQFNLEPPPSTPAKMWSD